MGLKIGLKWSGEAVGEGQERGWTDSTVRQQTCRQGADGVCWLLAFSAM